MKHLALVVLVLLASCDDSGGGKEKKTPRSPPEVVLEKMGELRDKACACKDLPCVEKVEKELVAWATKNMEMMKDMKPTKEQDERAEKLSDEMRACREKVDSAGSVP